MLERPFFKKQLLNLQSSNHGRTHSATSVSGQADRRRGHRRLGKKHAVQPRKRQPGAGRVAPFFTEWNSGELIKEGTKKGKKKMSLTPMTFSLLHATDFAHRLVHNILPPLKAGFIVLADRYVYTAFARDVIRGCDRDWVRKVYEFAPRPDLALYFNVPIDVSVSRILSGRGKLKDYEAGMDLELAADRVTSFRIFQGRILEEYARIAQEYGLHEIDATQSIGQQQEIVRSLFDQALADYAPAGPAEQEASAESLAASDQVVAAADQVSPADQEDAA